MNPNGARNSTHADLDPNYSRVKRAIILSLFLQLTSVKAHAEIGCTGLFSESARTGVFSVVLVESSDLTQEELSETIAHWNSCSDQGRAFPELVTQPPSGDLYYRITIEVNDLNAAGDGHCGEFNPGSPNTLSIFRSTTTPQNQIVPCGDISQTAAHEIGHWFGLRDAPLSTTCQNFVMSEITGNNRNSRAVQPEECSAVDEKWSTEAECGSADPPAEGCEAFPRDPIAEKPDLCTIVPELCIEPSPGVNQPWWLVSTETQPDCYFAIVEVDGVTTVERHCESVGGGGVGAESTSQAPGPASGFYQPAEGAIVGGTVQLDGWSLDDDGGVTGTLGFWLDGQPALVTGATYGEHDAVACSGRVDPACPYVGFSGALDTTVLADGTHTIELVTSETAPERPTPGYADSTFVVDNTRPTASITAPTYGTTVSGTVSVTASASDTNGINLVSFYVDGAYQATDSTSPYSFSWSSGDWANGSHALKIVAWDEAGNSRTVTRSVTVSNDLQTPQVSVTLPANGALVRGTVTFRAVATDDQGVSYVELYRDGVLVKTDPVLPYQWAWETTAGPDGSYTLTARAYDAGGNVGVSAPVTVTVDNTLPSRYVDIPSHQQSVEGTSARIAGWAIDSSGITSHTFAIDGQPLAVTNLVTNLSRSGVCAAYPSIQDPACPYVGWRANFDATQFSNGPHTLTLTVQDSAGNVDSFARQLVIDNPASMAVFHPVADATAWQAYPTNNTGMSTILATRTTSGGEGAYSFLKFDVSGITGTVVSAQLEFRTDGSMYDLWLYWLTSNAWTEGSITWSSFPGPGGTLDYRYNLAASTWYSYDVSSFVTGNGTYSMGFAGSNSSYAYVWSRESSFSPVLRVSYLP